MALGVVRFLACDSFFYLYNTSFLGDQQPLDKHLLKVWLGSEWAEDRGHGSKRPVLTATLESCRVCWPSPTMAAPSRTH